MIVQIPMPYIGSCLSVNHYKVGKYYTRPETKQWMVALQVRANFHLGRAVVKYPPVIHLCGIFKDKRSCPDLNNLHKVIADALIPVLGDDREFRFVDEGYTIDKSKLPMLVIGVEVEDAIDIHPDTETGIR